MSFAQHIKQNTISVSPRGGDFTSVKTALDSITDNSSSNRYVIEIYPGVYSEAAMGLKGYVDLKGMSRVTTRINATTLDAPLFDNTGISGPMVLSNLMLQCLDVHTAEGIWANSAPSSIILQYVDLGDFKYPVRCSAGVMAASYVQTSRPCTCTYFWYCDGGEMRLSNTNQGHSTVTADAFVYADGGDVHLNTATLTKAGVVTGIHATNGAHVLVNDFMMKYGTNGVVIDGASHVDASNLHLWDNLTNHVTILDNDSEYHQVSGFMSSDKFVAPGGYNLDIMSFIDKKEDDEGFKIYGELGVGRPELGKESVFGEGDSYTRGMLVYTYDTSSYVDVSTAARSASTSTFTFPATASGNAIYVSSDLVNGSDYVQFFGVKANTTTAAVLGGGEIVTEYWNGSDWVHLHTMCTNSLSPYLPYGETIFEREQFEQIRFNYEMLDDWTANDPVGTATGDRYWIRFRIDSAITTAPIFQQYKLHTNRHEVNADGYDEFFGKGRPKGTLPWSITDAKAWGSSPGNQDLFIFDSPESNDYDIGFGLSENSFAVAAFDRISIGRLLPLDMDTSCPIDIELYWMGTSSSAGDILFKKSAGVISVGDGVAITAGAAPATIRDGITTSTLVSVGAGEDSILKRTTFHVHLDSAVALHSDGSSDFMGISLARDGADGTDDYPGSLNILGVRATYAKWNNGTYIQ